MERWRVRRYWRLLTDRWLLGMDKHGGRTWRSWGGPGLGLGVWAGYDDDDSGYSLNLTITFSYEPNIINWKLLII